MKGQKMSLFLFSLFYWIIKYSAIKNDPLQADKGEREHMT